MKWSEDRKRRKAEQMRAINAEKRGEEPVYNLPPMQPAPLPPPPSRDQMIYTEGYMRGQLDGRKEAANIVLESLGFTLAETSSGSSSDQQQPPTPQVISEQKGAERSAQVSPLPSPTNVPVPPQEYSTLCVRCGHSMQDHEPMSSHACFVPGCRCAGYTDKQGVHIGPFRLG